MPKEMTRQEAFDLVSAETSLYDFFKQAWPHMGHGADFVDGWHVQAIAEHLEAIYKRDIKRLLINVPPRTGKSCLVSVAFPAWVWLHNPHEKFLYASYSANLSLEHSTRSRRLIESVWYQDRWGDKYGLAPDQNAKGFFENTFGGYRIATSVGATATGKGGSILVMDDPNNVSDGESKLTRESTNSWRAQVWSTRFNDAKNDCEIVIQQRCHEADVSGVITENDTSGHWVKLILPNEFESSRRSKTIILPSTHGKVWQDPRTEEGELLCDKRFGLEETKAAQKTLGSYGYAGQYQQSPSPADGGIFKKSWFRRWKGEFPPFYGVIQSWDTAYSEKPTSDYSACTTWGLWENHYGTMNMVLLSLWRGRVEYHELLRRAKRLYDDYYDTGKEKNVGIKGKHVDICLIEATGFGDQLIRDLQIARITAKPFKPKEHGDKIRRAHLVSPLIEDGRAWLLSQPPSHTSLMPFAQEFERYALLFPKADSRDVIDTMTQAMLYLKEGFHIRRACDYDDDEDIPAKPPVKVY